MSERARVPVAFVHADPALNVSREGQSITDADVAELAADIERHGQTDPVGVVALDQAAWLTPDDRERLTMQRKLYVLIYGNRRHRACELLAAQDKVLTIRVDVLDGSFTMGDAELANLHENWGHKPPTEYQLAWAVHRMVTLRKLDPQLVALRTNRKAPWILASVRIFDRVDPELLQWYRANNSALIRRRMIALAEIEALSVTARHRMQRELWAAWETADAAERRTSLQGGVAKRGPDKHQRAARDLRNRVRAVIDGPGNDTSKLARIRDLVEG